jgi:opacity protein-like surface antigen
MPVKALPVAAPVPVFTWTGFYLGGHVGYLWGHTNIEEREIILASGHTNGFVGGVLGGANWQTGPPVFGGEADIGWSNAHDSKLGQFDELFEYSIRWTSHVRGRMTASELVYLRNERGGCDPLKMAGGSAAPQHVRAGPVARHSLTLEEFALPLAELEKRYPAPPQQKLFSFA